MRGHIRRRGSSWTVVYDEGQDERGKRRQRTKGGFATKREASAYLTDQLSRLESGSYAPPSKLTTKDYLEQEWLPAVESTLRPLSFNAYKTVVSRQLVPHIGQVRLQALSGAHLNALYRALEQAGLAVATRRLAHAACTARCATLSAGDG